ncbi:phosphoribosylformylglycinamidine synthase, partial [candidate division KSB3 bacterium]|nr:phosphoribosylformylglycinamidine synthase [candidate division KSB3 bacterium]MBD3323365.1 phosphoribosylformylglycinamidine synthase [candidate division KSB3 bacterium]
MTEHIAHIHRILKEHIRDVEGEKVAGTAWKYLGIHTGKVKSSKIYSVLYALSAQEIQDFANFCLKDDIVDEVLINRFYRDPLYRSYILVAKLPGVTDDEGISAQKTLSDFLNVPLDTNTQHIFTKDLFLIEHALGKDQLRMIAEELLGNTLIHHFEYGPCQQKKMNFGYVPEVLIPTHEHADTVDIFVSDEQLLDLSKKKVLSLNLAEMKAIQRYYADPDIKAQRKNIGIPELPTDCEIEVLAQTWSEHCKHKEFNALIHYEDLDTGEKKTIDSLFTTYIKGSTDIIQHALEAHGQHWLVNVFADNAGVVRIDDRSLFIWKVETHNSPSAIDPYG